MNEHNTQTSGTCQSCQLHIVHIFTADEFGAHNPGKAGNKGNSQGNDHIPLSRPQKADKNQRQKDAWKREYHIIDTHQHLIQQTAEISRKSAQKHPEKGAYGNGRQRHRQRCAAALHHPAQDIPAEIIAPEGMGERGAGKLICIIHSRWIIWCIKDSDKHHQQDKTCENASEN